MGSRTDGPARHRFRKVPGSGWKTVAVLLALLILAGCGEDAEDVVSTSTGSAPAVSTLQNDEGAAADVEQTSDAPTAQEVQSGMQSMQAVIGAHNKLGLLLHAALADAEEGNVFISPSSIALALSMAYNGARGETAEAMAEALQMKGIDLAEVNEAHRHMLASYAAGEDELGVQLRIANSLWHRASFVANSQFRDVVAAYYRGVAQALNFSDPGAVDVINEWVEKQTEGLIPDLLDRLDDDLVALLVNTVYFKGMWTTPFDAAFTRDMEFNGERGVRLIPFMYRDGRFDHRRGDGFEAVRLPYGDGRMAMYVFLPDESADLAALREFIAATPADELFDGFDNKFGEVRLPKMDVQFKTKLNDVLTGLGMGVAFNPGRADFSGLTDSDHASATRDGEGIVAAGPNFYIGEVLHQSVLKVDEEGTEAAAATSIGVRVTSMPMYEFRFTADRPFFLAIRDDETGALLFVGSISNPLDS